MTILWIDIDLSINKRSTGFVSVHADHTHCIWLIVLFIPMSLGISIINARFFLCEQLAHLLTSIRQECAPSSSAAPAWLHIYSFIWPTLRPSDRWCMQIYYHIFAAGQYTSICTNYHVAWWKSGGKTGRAAFFVGEKTALPVFDSWLRYASIAHAFSNDPSRFCLCVPTRISIAFFFLSFILISILRVIYCHGFSCKKKILIFFN